VPGWSPIGSIDWLDWLVTDFVSSYSVNGSAVVNGYFQDQVTFVEVNESDGFVYSIFKTAAAVILLLDSWREVSMANRAGWQLTRRCNCPGWHDRQESCLPKGSDCMIGSGASDDGFSVVGPAMRLYRKRPLS
jgi:hypothetical protein